MVRSSQALRCLQGQSALYTLIHQRHPAPSCGGHAPTAERTMDPARNIKKRNFTESLTPDPELENKPRSFPTASFRACTARCLLLLPERPELWAQIGSNTAAYRPLTWPAFFSGLIPVTIGNINGRGGLVGGVYWDIYLRPRRST